VVSLNFNSRPYRDTHAHTPFALDTIDIFKFDLYSKSETNVAWNSIFKSWSSSILASVAQRVGNSHAWSFTKWHANFLELCYDVFNFIGP
jgi:hypothetical protein